MKYCLLAALLALLATGPDAEAFTDQAELDAFASDTALSVGVLSNFKPEGKFTGLIAFRNSSKAALPAGTASWRIYLHSIRKLDTAVVNGLSVSHIQGDLHQIEPTAAFRGLAPGATLELELTGANWMVSYSDFMPRAFITDSGLQPAVFGNTDSEDLTAFVMPFNNDEQRLRQPDDSFDPVTAGRRYQNNLQVNKAQVDTSKTLSRVFPTPVSVQYHGESTRIDDGWTIQAGDSGAFEADYLAERLRQQAGVNLAKARPGAEAQRSSIQLHLVPGAHAPESYQLRVNVHDISIESSDTAGLFYGVQSLLGVLPVTQPKGFADVPLMTVKDSPRYPWRGMHYDMARNFHGMDVTLRLIEQMGRFKLNRLHLHLTDDEGWRLQIPGLPELTEIGAQRCFDLSETRCLLTQLGSGPDADSAGNGYYSREDFIRLLRYAADRHIEVIPEVDVPGHSRAAIVSMRERRRRLMATGETSAADSYSLSDPDDASRYLSVQNYDDNAINVCMPSSYRFIGKVVDEIALMYRDAGLRLDKFHVGGDEVGKGAWQDSDHCRRLLSSAGGPGSIAGLKPYFMARVAAMLQERKIAMMGWEDGLMLDATTPIDRALLKNDSVAANVWDNIWEWGVADRAYRLANAGYLVVLSHATHLYFDHPVEASAEERGYYWAARSTDSAKVFGYMPDSVYANADFTRMGEKITDLEQTVGRPLPKLDKPENILGMQGQVWSETIRTPEQLEQMVYPRLLMLAERSWHKAPWEGDRPDLAARDNAWAEMARLLALREIPRLQASAVAVALPKPGVSAADGVVSANSAFPGLAISYSIDHGSTWLPYRHPVPSGNGEICFRSASAELPAGPMQCLSIPDQRR